jgi:hypothetical protein
LILWATADTSVSGKLHSSAALKELDLVDTGVVVGEGVVQLHRLFAWSVVNYNCRKVGGDRSHAGPRPSVNSTSDFKVSDLTVYRDSSVGVVHTCSLISFSSV